MTFEEAKKIFLNRGYIEVPGGTYYDADKWRESVTVISEWLEQEPCEDCVSRKDMLSVLSQSHSLTQAWEGFEKLPSVIPKEKIIHCKDCKYRDYWGKCNKWSKELDAHKTYILDENMFCGFAEIKDGDRE